MEELDHKILLKENQLGITKEKEYIETIKQLEKEIGKVKERIKDKDQTISKLKNKIQFLETELNEKKLFINEVNNKQTIEICEEHPQNSEMIHKENELINELKLQIKQLNIEHDKKMKAVLSEKEKMKNENLYLNNKLTKIKKNVIEIATKFENEIQAKEKKSIYVNECNSQLFNEMVDKHKKILQEFSKVKNENNKYKKEIHQLETIILLQENKIKEYKNKNQLCNKLVYEKAHGINKQLSQPELTMSAQRSLFSNKIGKINYYTSNINNSIDTGFSNFNDLSLPIINK